SRNTIRNGTRRWPEGAGFIGGGLRICRVRGLWGWNRSALMWISFIVMRLGWGGFGRAREERRRLGRGWWRELTRSIGRCWRRGFRKIRWRRRIGCLRWWGRRITNGGSVISFVLILPFSGSLPRPPSPALCRRLVLPRSDRLLR